MRTDGTGLDWTGAVVGHVVARVGCSREVVGACIACSLRSGVALAPEILYFALVPACLCLPNHRVSL